MPSHYEATDLISRAFQGWTPYSSVQLTSTPAPAPSRTPSAGQPGTGGRGPRQFWRKTDPRTGEAYYIDESGRRLTPEEVKRHVREAGGENVRIWREGEGVPPAPPEQLPVAPPAQPAEVGPPAGAGQDPVEEALRAADMVLTAAYGGADEAIAKLTEEGLRRLRAINEWSMAGVGEKIAAAKLFGEESQATLEQAMKAAGTPIDVEGATAPIRLEQTAAQQMLAEKQAALQRAGGTVEQSFAARGGQIRAALPAALAQARLIANEILRKTGGGAGTEGVLDPELEALVRENKRLEEEMKNRMYKRTQEMMSDVEGLKGVAGTDRFNKAGEIAAKYDPVEYAQLLLMLGEPLDIVVDWLQKHKGMDKKSAEAAAAQAQSRLAK